MKTFKLNDCVGQMQGCIPDDVPFVHLEDIVPAAGLVLESIRWCFKRIKISNCQREPKKPAAILNETTSSHPHSLQYTVIDFFFGMASSDESKSTLLSGNRISPHGPNLY